MVIVIDEILGEAQHALTGASLLLCGLPVAGLLYPQVLPPAHQHVIAAAAIAFAQQREVVPGQVDPAGLGVRHAVLRREARHGRRRCPRSVLPPQPEPGANRDDQKRQPLQHNAQYDDRNPRRKATAAWSCKALANPPDDPLAPDGLRGTEPVAPWRRFGAW